MYYRIFLLASVLLAAACSNAPTKEAAPVAAPAPVAQHPTEATTAPNRAGPGSGVAIL